jgi:hypothetical protein
MRAINIANEKNRDARVGFESRAKKSAVKMVLPDGREKRNIQFVKTTVGIKDLLEKYRDIKKAAEAIIQGDPEINIEEAGRFIGKTSKLYFTSNGGIAYRLSFVQIVYDEKGAEKDRRDFSKLPQSINAEIPVRWTGKEFQKEEVLRKYVFTRNYQLRHTSGLSYDFLYDMAKQLHTRKTMVLVGCGKKGNEPILLSLGGTPYRGFLEGRIDGASYCLILHLTNMELRSV